MQAVELATARLEAAQMKASEAARDLQPPPETLEGANARLATVEAALAAAEDAAAAADVAEARYGKPGANATRAVERSLSMEGVSVVAKLATVADETLNRVLSTAYRGMLPVRLAARGVVCIRPSYAFFSHPSRTSCQLLSGELANQAGVGQPMGRLPWRTWVTCIRWYCGGNGVHMMKCHLQRHDVILSSMMSSHKAAACDATQCSVSSMM